MGTGLAYFRSVDYLTNIATGTNIAGSPTFVGGCAYSSFQVLGLGTGLGGSGGGGQGRMLIQATLAMPAVGSPTWVAVSVTNANNGSNVGTIVADGIYVLANTPYFLYVRPFVTTLSNVVDGRLDVTGTIQSQTSTA